MIKKQYKIKVTKKLINELKPYWKKLEKIEDDYFHEIYKLEKNMKKKLKISLEFFRCDGYYAGIGNEERTMKLIHAKELED